MASLQGTTFVGTTEVLASEVYVSGSGMTPWKTIFMCPGGEGNNQAWIHIRTPLPATNASSGSGWNPSIVEVKGYHSYFASYSYDFQAVINSAGDGSNAWYGSQIRINRGNTDGVIRPLPVVYKSTSTYSSYERVCIALPKVAGCYAGWSWIRWWNNTAILDTSAWATLGTTSSASAF